MPDVPDVLAVLRSHHPEGGGELAIGCGEGWYPLIGELHQRIVALAPSYEVTEIFQKYGVLVVRVRNVPAPHRDAVIEMIREVRERSETVCEQCGAPGVMCRDTMGWLETACPEHQRADELIACPDAEQYSELGVRD